MLGKTLRFVLPIIFIPLAISTTRGFLWMLKHVDYLNFKVYFLAGGFFFYPIFHIVFNKPMYIYAIGHEVVHVLATWICGGRVYSFRVSKNGGDVSVSKNNLFVRLSPYFVPIHTITLVLLYWILGRFYGLSSFSKEFIFLVGFSMSFHIFMTIEVMKTKQPDIVKTGYLFSILLIYVINIYVLALALSFIFKEISFLRFFTKTVIFSKNIYIDIFNKVIP